jgi:hypothetical protein
MNWNTYKNDIEGEEDHVVLLEDFKERRRLNVKHSLIYFYLVPSKLSTDEQISAEISHGSGWRRIQYTISCMTLY